MLEQQILLEAVLVAVQDDKNPPLMAAEAPLP
jgi:hypothetical protein